jgi:hypothetical protein
MATKLFVNRKSSEVHPGLVACYNEINLVGGTNEEKD